MPAQGPSLLGRVLDGPPVPARLQSVAGANVHVVGQAYERAQAADIRFRRGVHYTPIDVATRLAALAVDAAGVGPVCDPSVGGGAFLLGAAEALLAAGSSRASVVGELLWGIDLDPGAVEVAAAVVALWASDAGEWVTVPRGHLVAADTLACGSEAFAEAPVGGFRAVVGNPPFGNQMDARTARRSEATAALRARWGSTAGPYADTAAFFLLAGVSMLAPGGAMILVQPRSVLASGDAGPIRAYIDASPGLAGLWIAPRGIFDAEVEVCAPLIGAGAPAGVVRRFTGAGVGEIAAAARADESWAGLAAGLLGTPAVRLDGARLGERCSATAGFRDQFYGLAAHTLEAHEAVSRSAPLITVGMIDPFRSRWGQGQFRFAGRVWRSPVVDLDALERDNPTLRRWVEDRLRPKVLVATQTRVLEVLPDPDGLLVPSTPVVAVECERDDVWWLAAALSSPAVTAQAFARVAGAAMSSETLKLSARQVLELAQPTDLAAWGRGVDASRQVAAAGDAATWRSALVALGQAMAAAYEVCDPELEAWWERRLPRWR